MFTDIFVVTLDQIEIALGQRIKYPWIISDQKFYVEFGTPVTQIPPQDSNTHSFHRVNRYDFHGLCDDPRSDFRCPHANGRLLHHNFKVWE
jgi:hypothetical protein